MKLLPYACYCSADLCEVWPSGWIQEYLTRQCSGLTGHVAASGYPYGIKFWGSPVGDTSGAYPGMKPLTIRATCTHWCAIIAAPSALWIGTGM